KRHWVRVHKPCTPRVAFIDYQVRSNGVAAKASQAAASTLLNTDLSSITPCVAATRSPRVLTAHYDYQRPLRAALLHRTPPPALKLICTDPPSNPILCPPDRPAKFDRSFFLCQ
ncbi:unnamed protein product, partial [Laminaria digitata]